MKGTELMKECFTKLVHFCILPIVLVIAAGAAAQTNLPTAEEEDAARAKDVDTVTARPHLPAKYWESLMPEDKDKELVVKRCGFCHDSQRTVSFSRPKEQWQEVVGSMMGRGAPVTPEEFPVIVDYF